MFMANKGKIVISKSGPYLVSGKLPLDKAIEIVANGEPVKWGKGQHYPEQENYALCRCGHSKNKPFCDGTHVKISFDGTETASNKKYLDQAEKIEGSGMDLTDAQDFCASARFCHRKGSIWNLTQVSDNPKLKEIAIQEACDCPSGRLVAWDKKTGKAIEPEFEPSISLVEDPQARVSGPIWVKGGVKLESQDGTQYESRNRMALCRCGKSGNKPFCDGSHIQAKFSDGDKSLSK